MARQRCGRNKALIERGLQGQDLPGPRYIAARDLMRGVARMSRGLWAAGPGMAAEPHPRTRSSAVALAHAGREKVYAPNSRNTHAGHAYDASVVLQKIVPVGSRRQPGTKGSFAVPSRPHWKTQV